MSEKIELIIDENCTSWIEVPERTPQGNSNSGIRQTSGSGGIEPAKLDNALNLVKSFAKKAGDAFSSLDAACCPDEMNIALSLSFDAGTGVWGLAKISAGTEIRITIGWKNLKGVA